jgi:hypothetical protein
MRIRRRYRAAVIGLWTLSGTWCAKELTDGRVPLHMLDELGCTVAQARMLVECGLWADAPAGYVFIGWEKYQPTRAKVEAERKKEAERKAAYRLSRGDTGGTPPGVPLVSQPESGHPDPTRPDPTHKEKDIVHAARARQLAEEFDEWWAVYPNKKGKDAARRRYMTVRKTTEAQPLLDGARAYALLSAGEDKQFVKQPAGWLNDGRWADEHSTTQAAALPRAPVECHLHEGYPLPCAKCARDAEVPEGNHF